MKKYITEALSTFLLIFCGTGAIVVEQQTHALGLLGIALTWGLMVMVLAYTFGPLSGAHMNPAVSIGLWISKKFDGKDLIPYIGCQLLGAIIASLAIKLLFPNNTNLGATTPSGSYMQSFVLELIMTFILMVVILSTSKHQGSFAPIAIGSTIILEILFSGPICGASMNPARSFGPALVSLNFEALWIYVVATTAGAGLGAFIWSMLDNE
jgi:aquaporin NIP